jgi:Tfp pilus assembly protein PilF
VSRARRDLVLFAAAAALRVAHVLAIRDGPLFRYLLIDSAFYDSVGRTLARGDGFPEGVFFMNVLYGAFLGAVYAVSGGAGPLAALLLQAVLGSAAVVMVARLGDALGRSPDGTIAAAVLAAYGPAVFYDGALLTPSLLLFLTTAVVLVAARRPEKPLLLGALAGALVLGRANNVLLLLAFVALRLRRLREGLAPAGLLVLGAALVVLPVTLRNFLVSGELVPVTANAGMALWAGNHEGATGIYSAPQFLSNPVPEREAEDYRAEASRRAGFELTLAQSSRWWTRRTLERWVADPGAALALLGRKLRIFLNATESQTNLSYYFAMDFSPVLSVLRVHLGWILPLAILGLVTELRALWLPAIPIAVSLATCLLFYVSSEYRHPVVPCLLLFAAAGARRAVAIFRAPAPLPKRAAVALALAGLFVFVNFQDPFLARLQSKRVDYLNFGTLAAAAGRLDEAESFLRRSVAIDPSWSASRRKLAEVLARTGRVAEAGEEARRADALEGRELDGSTASLLAAKRLFEAGRFEDARRIFLTLAGSGGAEGAASLNNAGLCSMRLERAAEAESLFLAAVARDPLYVSPRIHLGRLALSLGDTASAEGRALEALELAPEDGRALRLLARARGEPGS